MLYFFKLLIFIYFLFCFLPGLSSVADKQRADGGGHFFPKLISLDFLREKGTNESREVFTTHIARVPLSQRTSIP